MKRIGLMGGTFNPIHTGHMAVAEMVCDHLKLDKVIFVPSNFPPHKSRKNVVSGKVRYEMVKLAIKNNVRFQVSDIELKREGKSYSIDTVKEFKKQFPKASFYFIIGRDSLETLDSWKSINELTKLVRFVAVNRPKSKGRPSKIQHTFIDLPELEISSTLIRQRIRSKKSVRYIVPDKVVDYIKKYRLYI